MQDGKTSVRVQRRSTGEIATARVQTPGGQVTCAGHAAVDAVPGTVAPVQPILRTIAGSMCGVPLPTGRAMDRLQAIDGTLIDNGMPLFVVRATDFGLSQEGGREALDADTGPKARLEAIRLQARPMMNRDDLRNKPDPEMTLVRARTRGGTISARSFIPRRLHASIGVFAAIGMATACTRTGSPAAGRVAVPPGGRFVIQRFAGAAEVLVETDTQGKVTGAGTLRTARKLLDGRVFG